MTEVSTPEAAPTETKQRRLGRRITVGVAVGLAIVLFLLAVTGIWAKRTVLSADRVVAAVDAAAADPAVVDALSTRITDEIVSLIDVSGIVQSVVPDGLDRLGPIVEAAVTRVIHDKVGDVVGSPRGRALLEAAVRKAHDAVIRVLEGDGLGLDAFFVKVDGEIRLDTVPLLVATIGQLQDEGVIPGNFDITEVANAATSSTAVQLLAKIFGVSVPDDFGQITILNAAQVEKASATLNTAQRALSIFQKATVLLAILAFVFIGVALALSLDRRRTTSQLLLGIGIGALIMRIGIDQVVAAVDRAINRVGARAAAVSITEELTATLARALMILAIVGIATGLIAKFLKPADDGSPSKLSTLATANPDIARIAIVGLGLVVLFITGIGFWAVLIVGLLVAAGVLYVNRNSATPAPPEPSAT
jgi:hypothetical protein